MLLEPRKWCRALKTTKEGVVEVLHDGKSCRHYLPVGPVWAVLAAWIRAVQQIDLL